MNLPPLAQLHKGTVIGYSRLHSGAKFTAVILSPTGSPLISIVHYCNAQLHSQDTVAYCNLTDYVVLHEYNVWDQLDLPFVWQEKLDKVLVG